MIYYEDAIGEVREFRKHLLALYDTPYLREMVESRLIDRGVRGFVEMLAQADSGALAWLVAMTPPDGFDDNGQWFEDDRAWQAACLDKFPRSPDASETAAERNSASMGVLGSGL